MWPADLEFETGFLSEPENKNLSDVKVEICPEKIKSCCKQHRLKILTAFTNVAPAAPIRSFVFFMGVCRKETRTKHI